MKNESFHSHSLCKKSDNLKLLRVFFHQKYSPRTKSTKFTINIIVFRKFDKVHPQMQPKNEHVFIAKLFSGLNRHLQEMKNG